MRKRRDNAYTASPPLAQNKAPIPIPINNIAISGPIIINDIKNFNSPAKKFQNVSIYHPSFLSYYSKRKYREKRDRLCLVCSYRITVISLMLRYFLTIRQHSFYAQSQDTRSQRVFYDISNSAPLIGRKYNCLSKLAPV